VTQVKTPELSTDVVMPTADGKRLPPNVARPRANATNHPVAKSSPLTPQLVNSKDFAENPTPRETTPNANSPPEPREDVRLEYVANLLSKLDLQLDLGLFQISLY